MTLPILIPILNLNSYLPKGFTDFFNQKYEIDLIGKSIIDEDFEKIKEKIKKEAKMKENDLKIKDKINITSNDFKIFNNDNEIKDEIIETSPNTNKDNKINIEAPKELIIEHQILKYYKLYDKYFYSCCLVKQGLHITGYIIFNKDNFDFFIFNKDNFDFLGFPREMKDKNYYYCDPNKNNLCFGSLRKNNDFYYLNIKFDDILYIYKRYYAFIDDGLEIFTKQNKSYYFVFNNIGNKDNKGENEIINIFLFI